MDNVFEKAASIRDVVFFYWAKAQGLVATKIGKAVLALPMLVIARYRAALVKANTYITDMKACTTLLDRAEQRGYF